MQQEWSDCKLKDFINLFDSKRVPLSSKDRGERQGVYPYYGATGIMDYVNDYIFDGDYILLAEDGSTSDAKGFPIVQYIWGKNWVNNHAQFLPQIYCTIGKPFEIGRASCRERV